MTRAFKSLATIVLTGILLLGAFAVIASLDEFARLPFYYTLPLLALIVNSTVAIVLWQRRPAVANWQQAYSIFAVRRRGQAVQAEPSVAGNTAQASTADPVGQESVRQEWPVGSAQEIEAALAKVHAIAWGFPVTKRTVNPIDPDYRSNYEAHR
jgi:hypothetical protein